MIEFPFVGRVEELKTLKDLMRKKSSSLVVLKGRRRIGKSRLTQEFAKEYKFLSFSGMVPTIHTTAQSEINEFTRQLASNLNYPEFKRSDWSDVFSILAKETTKGRVVILFDEISWMGSKSPDFLGKLKNAWDLEFKSNPQLIFVLCGSVSSWIEDNILSGAGFMGRLSAVLTLKELKLTECNMLLNKIGFCASIYERFKMLAVIGGVPRYLEEINPSKLADENIKDLCFKSSGILFREFEDIFVDIFAKRSDLYKTIVRCLADGAKEFSDIAESVGLQKGGHLSEYLSDLIQAGFIRRDYTWNIASRKESKLSCYRLSDNYLRFYLKYIEPNKGRIENGHFNTNAISTLPGFSSIIGLQFKNLVLNNRSAVIEALNISSSDVVVDNPYFQTAQTRRHGCQIDYLIQTKSNILFACEIKFSKDKIAAEVVQSVKQKLTHLVLPKGFAIIPVLIHVSGVTDSVIEQDYFGHIIDFSMLV